MGLSRVSVSPNGYHEISSLCDTRTVINWSLCLFMCRGCASRCSKCIGRRPDRTRAETLLPCVLVNTFSVDQELQMRTRPPSVRRGRGMYYFFSTFSSFARRETAIERGSRIVYRPSFPCVPVKLVARYASTL